MKHQTLKQVLCAVAVLVLLAAAGMKLLPFAYAEQYQVGDAEITVPVRGLEINWTSGKVHIAYHSGATVLLSEKTTGTVSEDMRMRWRLDGDVLRVEYDQPGFHFFSLFSHSKELTVTLPQGLTLHTANISVTSGEMDIPVLYAENITLKSTSGDIGASVYARTVQSNLTSGKMALQVRNEADDITLHATSGDIVLEAVGAKNQTVIETTSGNIQATVKEAGAFKAKSTSGAVHAVIGQAKQAEIGSTSGRVIVDIASFDALDIHTTSGGVTAYLPAAPGFTANVETVSGRFEHHLPMTSQGNAYIAGNGSGNVRIHTTSGIITISAKEQ